MLEQKACFRQCFVKDTIGLNNKVMKRIDVRNDKLQEKWEGPYTVVSFNKRSDGYKLLDMVGKLYKKAIPINHL